MKANLPDFLMFTRIPGFSSYILLTSVIISESSLTSVVAAYRCPQFLSVEWLFGPSEERNMVLCSGPVAKTPLAKYAETLVTSESDGDSRRDTGSQEGLSCQFSTCQVISILKLVTSQPEYYVIMIFYV